MSQHDMDVANAAGATVRADINLALKALASFNSGVIPPATPYAYQIYVDTSTLPGANAIVYIRTGANTAWIRWGYINKTTGQLVVDLCTEALGFATGIKMIFYADVAPTGWTLLNTLDDKILYITKGSAAGGQTGGGVHSTGSWTISGITVNAHTHTGPSHTHTGPSHTHLAPRNSWGANGGTFSGRLLTSDGGLDLTYTAIGDNATNAGGTGATGAEGTGASGVASVNTITSAGGWRPSAFCSIICQKN